MSEQTNQALPLPVVVQPDPMLEDRAGPFRTFVAMVGGAFVVVLVLYGLSRPPEPQVMAAAPEAGQTAGQPAPAQNSQPPSTTGSGKQGAQQAPAQPGTAKANPGEKLSDSATTGKATAAPSDKSQPQKQ